LELKSPWVKGILLGGIVAVVMTVAICHETGWKEVVLVGLAGLIGVAKDS